MLTLIDRQLIRNYFKGYFICLSSLLSLYVVVDLFTNLDDFSHHNGGVSQTLRLIGVYYGYKVWQIFDRLCEAILVLAATFTIAWMRRNNEQVPLLSSGVSTQRIVRPVLLSACVLMSFNILNQELIIPSIGTKLMYQRDDPDGEKEVQVRGGYEPNGIHLHGAKAKRTGFLIYNFQCIIPTEVFGILTTLSANEARYVPPGSGPRTGGWELSGTIPEEVENLPKNLCLEQIDKGKYFLKVLKIDFEAMTRHQNAFLLSSTSQIYHELNGDDSRQGANSLDRKKAVLFHSRLTRPLLSIVLVVLSLSIILGDQNRNIYISVGMCLGVCALFFAASYICRYLGDNNLINPALSAWLPLLLFGPYAVVKFDSVHT
jgi:lipopolysaccharide export system permease protein